MKEFDDFKADFETFKGDLSGALANATAKIDKLLANQNDPTVAQGLVDLKAELDAVDGTVKAFDPGSQA